MNFHNCEIRHGALIFDTPLRKSEINLANQCGLIIHDDIILLSDNNEKLYNFLIMLNKISIVIASI